MVADLIHTKISRPPPRARLVHRERLYNRLDARADRKLTLVTAPAGFGKSTLLSSWAERRGFPVAWYALDESDNDPERFLAYLLTALHAVIPQLNLLESSAALRQSRQASAIEALLAFLANEFRQVETPVGVVLDDYHVIDNPAVHGLLSFLIEHLPPVFRFFIASRQEPGFSVARLRASGQVFEVAAADLRFTAEEAAQFLHDGMRLEVSPQAIAALEARTEGWIAGLQLAALSLEGRADAEAFIEALRGTDRYILDYLADEVFSRLSKPLQAFLVRISVAERFNADLCAALAAAGDEAEAMRPQAVIDFLDASNLFVVPLDHERRWYRFHHLFADFLRSRLGDLPPDEIRDLHRQAAQWHASHGLFGEAIQQALKADDPAGAAALIESQVRPMLSRGHTRALARWIEALPEAVLRTRPRLQLGLAWAYILSDAVRFQTGILQMAGMLSVTLQADRQTILAKLAEPGLDAARRDVLGQFALLLALLSRGHEPAESVIGLFQAAEAALPREDHFARAWALGVLASTYAQHGDLALAEQTFAQAAETGRQSDSPYIYLTARGWEATTQAQRGALSRAAETYRSLIEQIRAAAADQLPMTGHTFVGLADILLERNDLEAARQHIAAGIEHSQRTMDQEALRDGYMVQARILQALNDGPGARQALEAGLREARRTGSPACIAEAEAWAAVVNLGLGDDPAAAGWAAERGLLAQPEPGRLDSLAPVERMALARVLGARGDFAPARAILSGLLKLAEAGRLERLAIEARCALAPVLHALGDRDGAQRMLARALLDGEAEGYVRCFLSEGPRMAALLRTAAASGHSGAYVERLLEAFGPALSQEQPIEALTERELEVLRLLSQGLTNAAIAEQLTVAQSTVKTHINHIYAKLGVSQRTQAVARARELRLLL